MYKRQSVNLKYYSQARELLYQMLGEEENREFAERELQYLESMGASDDAKRNEWEECEEVEWKFHGIS